MKSCLFWRTKKNVSWAFKVVTCEKVIEFNRIRIFLYARVREIGGIQGFWF